MRHLMANIATYVIAALLFIGAAMFGRMRSSQLLLTRESAVLAAHQPSTPGFDWLDIGRSAYVRNCENCHGSAGRGWDQYPPLSPVRAIFEREGGREYLIDTHLYGVDSHRWRVPMPAMGHMHDVEIAAVINYILVAFGRIDPATPLLLPQEIATRRGRGLSAGAVDGLRPDDRPLFRQRIPPE
jgi:hypothetical protein